MTETFFYLQKLLLSNVSGDRVSNFGDVELAVRADTEGTLERFETDVGAKLTDRGSEPDAVLAEELPLHRLLALDAMRPNLLQGSLWRIQGRNKKPQPHVEYEEPKAVFNYKLQI